MVAGNGNYRDDSDLSHTYSRHVLAELLAVCAYEGYI